MQCVQHPGSPATDRCSRCGQALCARCAEAFTPPLCLGCAREDAAQRTAQASHHMFVLLALFAAGLVIGMTPASRPGNTDALLWGAIVGGFPTAWRILSPQSASRIFANVGSRMPALTIVIFAVKVTLCLCTGWLLFVVELVLQGREWYRIWQLDQRIKEVEGST